MIQGLYPTIEIDAKYPGMAYHRIKKLIGMPEYDCVNIYIREYGVDATFYRNDVEEEMVANGVDLDEKDWMCAVVEKELCVIDGFDEYVLSMIVDPHISQVTMMIGGTEVLITKNRMRNY